MFALGRKETQGQMLCQLHKRTSSRVQGMFRASTLLDPLSRIDSLVILLSQHLSDSMGLYKSHRLKVHLMPLEVDVMFQIQQALMKMSKVCDAMAPTARYLGLLK